MKITENGGLSYREELDAILNSDLSGMDKLATAFGGLTGFMVEVAGHEIELARAMGDEQEKIKQQPCLAPDRGDSYGGLRCWHGSHP